MSFSKMPISKKIIAGYAIFFAILLIISGFVIFQNILSLNNTETLDVNNESDIYIKNALEDFLNACVWLRIMMMSDDYGDDVYIAAEKALDDAIKELNSGIEYTKTHNMAQRSQMMQNTLTSITKYKEMMAELDFLSHQKLDNKNKIPSLGGAITDSVSALIDSEKAIVRSAIGAGAADATESYDKLYNLDEIISSLYNARLLSTRLLYLDDTSLYGDIMISINEVRTKLNNYESIILVSQEELINTALSNLAAYEEHFTNHRDIANETNQYIETFTEFADDIQTTLRDASTITTEELRSIVDTMLTSSRISLTVVIVMMIIALVLNISLAFAIVSSINKALNDSIKKLSIATSNVVSASSQLTSAANDLAQGGSEQASAIEETSATMNESASMIQQSTDNTREAAILVNDTANNAVKGVAEMENLIDFMNKLSRSSSEIEQIIGSITDISFQTNILALNASVEAARAGEAGKSFTVVAEEVRSLSQKSSEAANNTSLIINTNIELSGESVKKSKSVGETLGNISTSIQRVNNLINEIAEASEEQSRGIQQINTALSQMEKVTQSNAAISQESAASASELKNQADILEQITAEIQNLAGRTAAV